MASSDGAVVLAAIMRFKQICNHPAQATPTGSYLPAESGKFNGCAELGEEIASRQEKALVFTQFREITEPLAGYLQTVFQQTGLVLHGGTPVGRRRALVESFQREDGPPFFCALAQGRRNGLESDRRFACDPF